MTILLLEYLYYCTIAFSFNHLNVQFVLFLFDFISAHSQHLRCIPMRLDIVWSVCVCMLVTWVTHAKMAELITVLFEG